MTDSRHQELFSDSRIALAREAAQHPDLVDLLSTYDPTDFEMQLGEIAAYCKIAVHGDYMHHEIDTLCEKLFNILRGKRAGIVVCQNIPKGLDVKKH